ncbi:MAG: aminoacetone oxidase family FAD-binding enzyme [Peptococcaceae bacterium]|jgi:predicted Rossmann fold flavoprotein|nr:aminoacetone oxidase family FAD-binding enzyme [Peptococcaceae bacterium]
MADTATIYDVAVIGGGASGMMAAVGAASRLGGDGQVVVLEGGQRVGRKLLATGNGRCNYSNTNIDAKAYNRPDFVARIYRACSPDDIIDRFAKSGLMSEEEEGRLYPISGTSSSMLDILRLLMEEKGVTVLTDFSVMNISWDRNFHLACAGGLVEARTIILACGGKAAPQLGSDGSGFKLAESLGHYVTDLKPGLTGLKCPTNKQRELGLPTLNGLRVTGTAYLYRDEKLLAQEKGEILFREFGLSGIAIFDLSRFSQGNRVSLDLLPNYPLPELKAELLKRAERLSGRPLEDFFTGVFHRIIGVQLMKVADLDVEDRDCGSLTKAELEQLAKLIKGWIFPIEGPVGWQNAQITLGGLDLNQFNALNLESQLVPGVFACGEILDVDGPCGGYNLQWAWSSGLLAGWSAAKSVKPNG